MEALYLKAIALGLAGFDPSGALLAIAWVAAGASRRLVLAFCVVYIAVTITVLTGLAVVLGGNLPGGGWHPLADDPAAKTVVELLAGLLLVAFAAYKIVSWRHPRPETPKAPRPPRHVSPGAVIGSAVLLGCGIVGNPALIALIAVSATSQSGWHVFSAELLAIFVNKLLVFVMIVALILNRQDIIAQWITDLWAKVAPRLGTILIYLLGGVGLVLIVEALW